MGDVTGEGIDSIWGVIISRFGGVCSRNLRCCLRVLRRVRFRVGLGGCIGVLRVIRCFISRVGLLRCRSLPAIRVRPLLSITDLQLTALLQTKVLPILTTIHACFHVWS